MSAHSQSENKILICQAELLGKGLLDVRITDGIITAIATALSPGSEEQVINASKGLLLPGLQDHHMHLMATAAAKNSVFCGPPAVKTESELEEVLVRVAADRTSKNNSDWIRGTGFHDSVCPELDRHWLDRVCPDHPVRIQHRSGMLWILNSRALNALQLSSKESLPTGVECDVTGKLTGRFYDLDRWLGKRLPKQKPNLHDLSVELARYGITGVTDTGVNNGQSVVESLSASVASGEVLQRLLIMGNEELHNLSSFNNSSFSNSSLNTELLSIGPLKIYLREANLPELDGLVERIRTAHECHRAVAAHCVTLVELYFYLAALREAGVMPGDRVEHASIADEQAIEQLAELGVQVVTQPHFIAERGDQYLTDVDSQDIPLLYRGAAFLSGGVSIAAGSDAPYGSLDPWEAMRAAIDRRTPEGVVMQAEESLTPLQALSLYGGSQTLPGAGLRDLAVGQSADLCLMDCSWEALQQDLSASRVALTVCNGQIIYQGSPFQSASCQGTFCQELKHE